MFTSQLGTINFNVNWLMIVSANHFYTNTSNFICSDKTIIIICLEYTRM